MLGLAARWNGRKGSQYGGFIPLSDEGLNFIGEGARLIFEKFNNFTS